LTSLFEVRGGEYIAVCAGLFSEDTDEHGAISKFLRLRFLSQNALEQQWFAAEATPGNKCHRPTRFLAISGSS
jgi:hypothetical protein